MRVIRRSYRLGMIATGLALGVALCWGFHAAALSGPADAVPVRVSPPVVSVAGLDRHEVSLNGTWNFLKDVPEGFDPAAPGEQEWAAVEVPGHFATQGHGRMHKVFGVPVAYHRSVDIPATWDGRRVVLRFDGKRYERQAVRVTEPGKSNSRKSPGPMPAGSSPVTVAREGRSGRPDG